MTRMTDFPLGGGLWRTEPNGSNTYLMNGLEVPRFEGNSGLNSFSSFIKGEATQILWWKCEKKSLEALQVKSYSFVVDTYGSHPWSSALALIENLTGPVWGLLG